MKKIIALLLTIMLVMVFTLGCKPAEKPAEAPATHEEPAPAEEAAPAEQPAAEMPAEGHEAPAESAH